jgi:adenine-specific DNA-methyltransferase
VQDFREQFDPENLLANPAAQIEQWQNARTSVPAHRRRAIQQHCVVQGRLGVSTSLLQSYVFIAIELQRGRLRARQAGKHCSPDQPYLPHARHGVVQGGGVVVHCSDQPRLNKRDESKDVLGKVTLIQNIGIAKPHPGHLDILASFSLAEFSADKRSIQNFDQLHAAWEEVFNVELLNKRFYEELSNWYFWARKQVSFPRLIWSLTKTPATPPVSSAY